jgi:hypothetical protein
MDILIKIITFIIDLVKDEVVKSKKNLTISEEFVSWFVQYRKWYFCVHLMTILKYR